MGYLYRMIVPRALRRAALLLAGLFLTFDSPAAEPSVVGRQFTVYESGASRVLVAFTSRSVRVGGRGEVLPALPQVTVPARTRDEAAALAERYRPVAWSPAGVGGHYTFTFSSPLEALAGAERLWADGIAASPVLLREKKPRFSPSDPLYRQQWHLSNRGQNGGTKGIDINVGRAWAQYRGRGVAIAVVDDGLELNHVDLVRNAFPLTKVASRSLHYDFVRGRTNPLPRMMDAHGTAVAGLAAGASNKFGGVGVAPRARLAGLRLLGAGITDGTEARALGHKSRRLHIYNNSWGPSDDGAEVSGPGPLAAASLRRGVSYGRGGRGSVFVWSAGNGRREFDDANYDGYANSIETIAVGAVSDRGVRTTDSETGANLVVVAPSSSTRRQGLITADLSGSRGYNRRGSNDGMVIPRKNVRDRDFTNDFGGTSGAAPIVSGVIALMLEANPKLGWREVQDILIRTARRVDRSGGGWRRNGAGLWFSHLYGAGLVDASAAVEAAKRTKRLGGVREIRQVWSGPSRAVPDNTARGVTIDLDFSKQRNLRVEHVQFLVTVAHEYRGDLRYELISPAGTVSVVPARLLDNGTELVQWPFMTVRNWGERSRGVWRVRLIDTASSDVGAVEEVEVVIRGTTVTKT